MIVSSNAVLVVLGNSNQKTSEPTVEEEKASSIFDLLFFFVIDMNSNRLSYMCCTG